VQVRGSAVDSAHARYGATEHYALSFKGLGPNRVADVQRQGKLLKSFMSLVVLLVYRMPLQPRNF